MLQNAIPGKSKKNYYQLGRILCKVKPDVALELIELAKPGEESDLTRIFTFYAIFDSNKPAGKNSADLRRIFTAAMLKMYHPFVLEKGIVTLKYGFVRNVSSCFACRKSHTSECVRDVITLYKTYEDFKNEVDAMFQIMRDSVKATAA